MVDGVSTLKTLLHFYGAKDRRHQRLMGTGTMTDGDSERVDRRSRFPLPFRAGWRWRGASRLYLFAGPWHVACDP